jgi:NDP-sugar pyrophosphorylase family protein
VTTVVVMAAGLGTRFGGLKQLAPVGPNGETIVDYSLAQAARAGFSRAVIVVRSEIEETIAAHFESRPPKLDWQLVCQDRDPLAAVPGREKPLGTAHAVLCVRPAVDGPLAAINADDLYPDSAYEQMHGHLAGPGDDHALIAFRVANTMLGSKPVSRARCVVDDAGYLVEVVEGKVVTADDRLTWLHGDQQEPLRGDELVSVNLFAFRPSIFDMLEEAVTAFVSSPQAAGPDEILLPDVVNEMIRSGRGVVTVLVNDGRMLGVTHPDDVPVVQEAAAHLIL